MVSQKISTSNSSRKGKARGPVSQRSIFLSRARAEAEERTALRQMRRASRASSTARRPEEAGASCGSLLSCAPSPARRRISSSAGSRGFTPPRRRAERPTTARPSSRSSPARSISTPRLSASSSILTQTTTGCSSSFICRAKIRLRSRQVASQTTTAASARPDSSKDRASRSSSEQASSE